MNSSIYTSEHHRAQSGNFEEVAFKNRLSATPRKPDFLTLPRKDADQSDLIDDLIHLEDPILLKSMDASLESQTKPKSHISSEISVIQMDMKNSTKIQSETSLWFEEIYKEIYIPLKYPHKRPDLTIKDAIVPEDVRYVIQMNQLKGLDLLEYIKNWTIINNHDETRVAHAYAKGGVLGFDSMLRKYRSTAKEIIAQAGKKILSGSFNLSTISFPIKAMVGESVLEKCSYAACLYPLYLNLALKTTDPLLRFKHVVTASISYNCFLEMFAKPVNPILGETFQGYYNDGTKVHLEQISHHPPISYMLVTGPHNAFTAYGPYACTPHAGLNSIKISSTGWRKIVFNDTKQEIHITNGNDEYEGCVLGKCVYRMTGAFELTDKANGISCQIVIGKSKKKLNDYFTGDIKVNGKPVAKVTGNLMGWLEIDGYRYFDHRYVQPFQFNIEKSPLESDSYRRNDILYLREGEVDKAQREKESLEISQRSDRKMREAREKLMKKKSSKAEKQKNIN